MKNNKKITLLYSGGLDSLYCAELLAKDFSEIHLLTYDVPGIVFFNLMNQNLNLLKKRHKNKIIVKKINIKSNFKKIIGNNLRIIKDIFAYKDMNIVCLGCKIIIFCYALNYCKKNKISYICDGSNSNQYSAWVKPTYQAIFNKFYKKNNIKRITPLYNKRNLPKNNPDSSFLNKFLNNFNFTNKRTTERNYLIQKGYNFRWCIGDRNEFIQPICLKKIFYNLPRLTLYTLFPNLYKYSDLDKYVNSKFKQCYARINNHYV